jgi:metallophosphoesterase (TIGR00282 family)
MRLLFLGDIVGRSGREALIERLPGIRKHMQLDFVVVNGENATSGAGLTGEHAKLILEAGADCITLGDHAFDQRDMLNYIASEPRIVRPINFAKSAPGSGAAIFTAQNGQKILVAQILGQVFMKRPYDDPFSAIETVLNKHRLSHTVNPAIVDVHREATSEKMALGHWCDGKVSLVVGTHTHIPTADTMILSKGTAYQSDAGMCGDYDSVIGMEKDEPLRRFVTGMSKGRFIPAKNPATLCGVMVETDRSSGLAKSVKPVRIGGALQSTEGVD